MPGIDEILSECTGKHSVEEQYKKVKGWKMRSSSRDGQIAMLQHVMDALNSDTTLKAPQKAAVLRSVLSGLETSLKQEVDNGNKPSKGLTALINHVREVAGLKSEMQRGDAAVFVDFHEKHKQEFTDPVSQQVNNELLPAMRARSNIDSGMSTFTQGSKQLGVHDLFAKGGAVDETFKNASRNWRKWLHGTSPRREVQIGFLQDIIQSTKNMMGDHGRSVSSTAEGNINKFSKQCQVMLGAITLLENEISKKDDLQYSRLGKMLAGMKEKIQKEAIDNHIDIKPETCARALSEHIQNRQGKFAYDGENVGKFKDKKTQEYASEFMQSLKTLHADVAKLPPEVTPSRTVTPMAQAKRQPPPPVARRSPPHSIPQEGRRELPAPPKRPTVPKRPGQF